MPPRSFAFTLLVVWASSIGVLGCTKPRETAPGSAVIKRDGGGNAEAGGSIPGTGATDAGVGSGNGACPADQHLCNGGCVDGRSVMTCGARCEPCPGVAGASVTCDGTKCVVACPTGMKQCLSACIEGSVVCNPTCPVGQNLCDGVCADDKSLSACGSSCLICPMSLNGQATCDGNKCDLTCKSGYHRCGDVCVSNTDLNNCGTSCTACPSITGGTASCDGTKCGGTCADPTVLCAGACIDKAMVCGGCPAGKNECNGTCVATGDVNFCGKDCLQCNVPANGTASCDGTACGFTCSAPFQKCGAECIPNDRQCNGACIAGLKPCGTACVSMATCCTSGRTGCSPCEVCNGGTCSAQADGTACGNGMVCAGGSCGNCGGNAQACCPGGSCNSGLSCSNGTCGITNVTFNISKGGNVAGSVTATWAGGGSLSCGPTCSASIPLGTQVTVTAAQPAGSAATLSGPGCSTNPCTVTAAAGGTTVTATFTLNQYLLAVTLAGPTGSGSVLSTTPGVGINCGASCSALVNHGTVVTLAATASGTGAFASWSGCTPTNSSPCSLTVTAATTVTATFRRRQGAACSVAGDCSTGLFCVGNVCCATACNRPCDASCQTGTCAPKAAKTFCATQPGPSGPGQKTDTTLYCDGSGSCIAPTINCSGTMCALMSNACCIGPGTQLSCFAPGSCLGQSSGDFFQGYACLGAADCPTNYECCNQANGPDLTGHWSTCIQAGTCPGTVVQ